MDDGIRGPRWKLNVYLSDPRRHLQPFISHNVPVAKLQRDLAPAIRRTGLDGSKTFDGGHYQFHRRDNTRFYSFGGPVRKLVGNLQTMGSGWGIELDRQERNHSRTTHTQYESYQHDPEGG